MLVYTSTRLTFKRDEIEALGEDDYFKIHVTNDNTSYKICDNIYCTIYYTTYYNTM